MRTRTVLLAALCSLALAVLVPPASATVEPAKPKPGAPGKRGFRLFARTLGALTVNRVLCGLNSDGEVCVDSTNSSTIGGGFWPKGTADQYVFNSGLQIAGVVGSDGGDWAGDTTGAFFFDPKGTTQHGEEVEPIYNTSNPDDLAFMQDTLSTDPVARASRVPKGDATADLYDPLLQGRAAASQADVWWLSWDGNPSLSAGRPHPLGILVEQRGLGWNFPVGNEDIIYFVYTFYNVTASDPNVYTAAGARPGMAEILARQGQEFQDKNEQAFGVDIPDGGYTVNSMFAAFSADMDVAEATVNFSSVNVPFALGYVYAHDFAPAAGWTFDPGIFSPPFFPGSGFVGVKYLKSPLDADGNEVGLTLFSNTINGGAFDDAQNTTQLYRYISNNISVPAGDANCNTGTPQDTHICFINNTAPDDMRFFQSSGPLTLGPGQFGSIVVAYIFAAPVITGSCTGPGTCDLAPGDPTVLSDAATLASDGANPVDSVAGFRGFRGPNTGPVNQDSIDVVPGSLLGKALVAQAVFNNKFLLPFAPEAPAFYLVPGNNQVTVLWQPTVSETTGDPFFATASSLTTTEGAPNPLYDPNYRQLDVEGYRVYRGRVDSPNSLALVAQFDYAGTTIADFTGQINPVASCAPELGINLPVAVDTSVTPPDTTFGCPATFDSLQDGVAPTVSVDYPLVGQIVQVKRGERTKLATGAAIILRADTATSGGGNGFPDLRDSGVPFIFVDRGVRSNLRYFYSVTSFDINSFQSGPSSIESPRITKPVTPVAAAGNFESKVTLTPSVEGRGVAVNTTSVPTLDPATGKFSGKFPAPNGVTPDFVGGFAQTLYLGQGAFSTTLIGLGLGDARNGIPVTYTYETSSATGVLDTVTISVVQPLDLDDVSSTSPPFPAATIDAGLSARYDVPAGYVQSGQLTQAIDGYQAQSAWGRGCFVDALFGGDCQFNGPRWFVGDNETKADPNAGNVAGSGNATDNNNAGELPGVLTIQNPQSYTQMSGGYRAVESTLAGAVRAADFNVYWGAAGKVDSVIDITDNVAVPFMTDSLGAGWGFLNQSGTTAAGSGDARPDVLTLLDFGCVFPLSDADRNPDQALGCEGAAYKLSDTAVPGSVAIYGGSAADGATAAARPNPGFGMYVSGQIFMFELAPPAAVPASGTVWTLRSYIGVVNGSTGTYKFTPGTRNFAALGASVKLSYDATNTLVAANKNDLTRVHTVPDPYYVTNEFEQTTDTKIIKFVNLPADAIVRIYSSSGVLVNMLEHHSDQFGGAENWNVRNRNNQVVASGVYFYHIEAGDARRVGRFTIVNFAQ
ncbi:MAG TPA: hypothetical protein VFG66_07820 [Gemmatimonadales bacterium]|nr:hypothetical protein [Gemmatimonadales bacterium]